MYPARSFSYKTAWLAVRAAEPEPLASALRLRKCRAATWEDGIKAAYERHSGEVFVTPGVEGWVLAVGLQNVSSPEKAGFLSWLEQTSADYDDVAFFLTHRAVEFHAWARASRGRVLRAYAYIGESGKVVLNVGKRQPEEIAASVGVADPFEEAEEDDDVTFPDENDVRAFAAAWSIDPSTLDGKHSQRRAGILGRPASRSFLDWFRRR